MKTLLILVLIKFDSGQINSYFFPDVPGNMHIFD